MGSGTIRSLRLGKKTLAEISTEEKSRISHRARALSAFHDWFIAQRGKNRG